MEFIAKHQSGHLSLVRETSSWFGGALWCFVSVNSPRRSYPLFRTPFSANISLFVLFNRSQGAFVLCFSRFLYIVCRQCPRTSPHFPHVVVHLKFALRFMT